MSALTTNTLLGYPPDARLLIVNADDFGMYPAINMGVVDAFDRGIVRSTTLMTPCPAAAEALAILQQRPDIPVGVHLTLVSDVAAHAWAPLCPPEEVPTLVDTTGHCYVYDRIPELLARATIDDVEREYRAQIGRVLDAGLRPTHLDWHCINNGGRADIFDLALALAREHGLALRVNDPALSARLLAAGLPVNEHPMLDSYRLSIEGKTATYLRLLRELPPGLTEWAVHPSTGDVDSQALDAGWPIRRADYDFLTSPEARATIEAEGIALLDYRPLQSAWSAASA